MKGDEYSLVDSLVVDNNNDDNDVVIHSPMLRPIELRQPLHDLDPSESSGNYIFADDDEEDDSTSDLVLRQTPCGDGAQNRNGDDKNYHNNNNDEYSLLALKYKSLAFDDESESRPSTGEKWSSFSQARILIDTTTAASVNNHSKNLEVNPLVDDLERAPTAAARKSKGALGRIGPRRLLFTRQKSFPMSSKNLVVRHGGGHELLHPPPTTSRDGNNKWEEHARRSAVNVRNDHFDDWEVQAAPRSLLSTSNRALLFAGHASDVSSLSSQESNNSSNNNDNNQHRPAMRAHASFRSTLLTAKSVKSSVVASIINEQRQREKASAQNTEKVCSDGLDCRLTSDHVATMLQLGHDAEQLLASLRGRSGAVNFMAEDEQDDNNHHHHHQQQRKQQEQQQLVTAVQKSEELPYLHVSGDVWIPHYEEYVVRMVDAFGRFLVNPAARNKIGHK